MKSIIIEDEALAAQSLENLILEVDSSIEIAAVLQSIDESVIWFKENTMPDLVFMDIHLADGSSFSIFDEVDITCPIIFTTAYDEYALKAFQVNSIDYLLKPINKEDLQRAITKYKNFSSSNQGNNDALANLLASIKEDKKAKRTHFLIPSKDKLIPLPVSDIAYIYIETGIVKAVGCDQQSFVLDQPLDILMEELDNYKFFRANRQYIIAHNAIEDISLWFGGKLSVNMVVPTPDKIIVSKAKLSEFKKWYAGEADS